MTQDEAERADLRTIEQRDFDNLLRDYHALADRFSSAEKRAEEAERQLGECSGGYETLEKELADVRSSLARQSKQFFHDAWGYAKEHPEECSDGYDKRAFGHVQFWLDKVRSALHRSQGE